MSELFIGIDIGTTGVRAAIFNPTGDIKGYSYVEYPLLTDTQGKAELLPETVLASFIKVVKAAITENDINGSDIKGIGLSAQMHSFIAIDNKGNCLTNIIIWADSRPLQTSRLIEKDHDCMSLYNTTGCRVQHPAYYPAKILWLKKNYPDIFAKAYKFITLKEFILFKLYGEYLIDVSDASATGCFNIHNHQWEDTILYEVAGINKSRFGEVVDCTYTLKNMKSQYAKHMCLKESTPLIIGSTDGIMANLGCGGIDSSTMSCTIGTSGALRIAVDKPLLDINQSTWCYCFTKRKWVAGGVVNDGGIDLKWFRDQLKGPYEEDMAKYNLKNVYQLFDKYASEIKPGSDGLIFLPYLNGERSPGWHSDAAAHICGLKYGHGTRHFIRAAMEGVLFNMFTLYLNLSSMDKDGSMNNGVQRIVANGGYVKSKAWLQMQADIFKRKIYVSSIGEAAAWGAAFTAMVALGVADGFDSIGKGYDESSAIEPISENQEVYIEAYSKFKQLYNQLINR